MTQPDLGKRRAGAFRSGFVGCFGVGAAVLLVAVVGIWVMFLLGDQQQRSEEAAALQGERYLAQCWTAVGVVRASAGRGSWVYRQGAQPVVRSPGPPVAVECPFMTGDRPTTVRIGVLCTRAWDRDCVVVQAIED